MSQLIKEQYRLKLLLSEAEQQTLEEAVRHHPHPDARERASALLQVHRGHSPHWVASSGLLRPRDPDSVYQWLGYYQDEGIAGLFGRRHGGPHRRHL